MMSMGLEYVHIKHDSKGIDVVQLGSHLESVYTHGPMVRIL